MNKDKYYSFDTILVERERYVKELWEAYSKIIGSVSHPWRYLMGKYSRPKMVPIRRVVRAPRYKSYKYTPRLSIRYVVTDPSGT